VEEPEAPVVPAPRKRAAAPPPAPAPAPAPTKTKTTKTAVAAAPVVAKTAKKQAAPPAVVDDEDDVEAVAPPPPAAPKPAPLPPKFLEEYTNLAKTVAKLQQKVLEMASTMDCARQFYGCVSGGSKGLLLLYNAIPQNKEERAKSAVAKAQKGAWLKLSYPRKIVTDNHVAYTWYRVHILQDDEIKLFWVCNKNDDGESNFSSFKFTEATAVDGDDDEDEDDDDDEDDEDEDDEE
jgi:hypothetical protein